MIITIQKLDFQYPGATNKVLNSIDLSIAKRSLFGLIGPNGAGKTTLISLLTGLLKPTGGTIVIDGHDLSQSLSQAKRLISYVPQDYAFYPNLTAIENLKFFAGVQKIDSSSMQSRINYCLDFCQLHNVANQRAAQFSGGLKRRLNIAIGLLQNSSILIFDEPTVGIDPQSRAFILQQINELKSEGKTIIYTSHYMEEVEQLCDCLAIIDHGELLKQGTLPELQQEQKQQLFVEVEDDLDDLMIDRLKSRYELSVSHRKIVFHNIETMTAYSQVMSLIEELGLTVNRISYDKRNLEQLFLELTSKQLRD